MVQRYGHKAVAGAPPEQRPSTEAEVDLIVQATLKQWDNCVICGDKWSIDKIQRSSRPLMDLLPVIFTVNQILKMVTY